MAATFQQ